MVPLHIKCLLRRAVAYRQLGRCNDARRSLETVLSQEPDNGQAMDEMEKVKIKEGAAVLPTSSPSLGLLGLGEAVSRIHDEVRSKLPSAP